MRPLSENCINIRCQVRCTSFFFFEPILFWYTSPRLSPVVTTSRYICETLVNNRWPLHSQETTHEGKEFR
jgi:hypothetical protein